MNKDKPTKHIWVGAIICALYVALGAFGAHGLKDALDSSQIATYETGLRYMIIHGLGLILISSVYILLQKYNIWPAILFYIGLVLFSLSLIVHATKDLLGISIDVFALFAPFGGLSFIAGWILFTISIRTK
ncbi:DUF423 domain-containing protein [Bacteroidia bacterium]|nr:DUF423 domain-containing protein [Bacteroidia bacterium]MDB9882101.1 DUF423 domain-containing protein [Bacteroidia bacterium]MDC1395327.1 DUF423 domain-containing protein [Bacteroidia bacterium]